MPRTLINVDGVSLPVRLKSRYAGPAIGILLATKIILLFVLAWNRRFVMDEFVQFGWAQYLSNGLFETIWPAKAVGYAIFFRLAHLIGWDAHSMLLIGRLQTALLGCATLALIYGSARSLGQSRMRSALILLILLSFSDFIERIFETRAEPLATFFGAAALLVAIRAESRPGRLVCAGLLSGLAFLATQKAVYFNLALGLALVGDAGLERHLRRGIARGFWLILGWLFAVSLYCLYFGGWHPLPVVQHLFLGPLPVASSQTAAEYGGLRNFVAQTLGRNALLYVFCFAGMALATIRIRQIRSSDRIALIFSLVVTVLIFSHNQPWPYVFVMALPFMALWALQPFDALSDKPVYLPALTAVLVVAVAGSFARNIRYLELNNDAQLAIVDRVEALLARNETYFDGVAMLPNRPQPSIIWLDRHGVLITLREGDRSVAYKVFASTPPKVIIWSYRMDAINSVVGPLIDESYVSVAPNVRMAGRKLHLGDTTQFKVPISGSYALYSPTGKRVPGRIEVDGRSRGFPVQLERGVNSIRLVEGTAGALLLPKGDYDGKIRPGSDDRSLFNGVYD